MAATEKSPRRFLGELLLDLARSVRNRGYYARRGAVNWSAFDFKSRPRAIAVVFDEVNLFPNANAVYPIRGALEMFAKFDDSGAGDSIDDALMDELYEDARWIFEQAIQATRTPEEAAVLGADQVNMQAIETHDAGLQVQGLIVPFTVSV